MPGTLGVVDSWFTGPPLDLASTAARMAVLRSVAFLAGESGICVCVSRESTGMAWDGRID